MAIGVPQLIGSPVDDSTSGAGEDVVVTVGVGGVPLGAVIFLCVADIGSGSTSIDAVSDTRGNSYTVPAREELDHGSASVGGFLTSGVVTTALQSGDTITISFSAFNFVGVCAYYVTGLSPTGFVDAVSTVINFSTSFASGGIATTGDAILIGLNSCSQDTLTYTATNSYNELNDVQLTTAGNRMQTQYRIVSSNGTYDSTATCSNLDDGVAMQIAWAGETAAGGGRLFGPALLTNAAATKYTSPAGGALINEIHVSNPTASPVDFTLSVGSDAAGTRLFDAYPIPADSMQEFAVYLPLGNAEIVQAYAGTNNVITLTIDGFEL